MEITVSQKQGRVPVTILHLSGSLDGATYQMLTKQAKKVYHQGARDHSLDLTALSFISSAGITSLHKTSMLFRGATFQVDEEGWESFRAIDHDRDSGV